MVLICECLRTASSTRRTVHRIRVPSFYQDLAISKIWSHPDTLTRNDSATLMLPMFRTGAMSVMRDHKRHSHCSSQNRTMLPKELKRRHSHTLFGSSMVVSGTFVVLEDLDSERARRRAQNSADSIRRITTIETTPAPAALPLESAKRKPLLRG